MLPVTDNSINLDTIIEFQDYPTNTFYIDPVTKQVIGQRDGLLAMRQAVEIIFNVERFKWQIYSPNFGIELDGLIGSDYDLTISELKRRAEEALIPDNRILGASDFVFTQPAQEIIACAFTVNTVYGNFETGFEVTNYY